MRGGLIRRQIATLRNGFLFSLLFIAIAYLAYWIWHFVQEVGWSFSQNPLLNFSLNVLVILIGSYLAGIILVIPWFKKALSVLLGKLPLIGSLLKFMDFLEVIKRKGAPEVEFDIAPGSGRWTLGWVSNEWQEGDTTWCTVHCPIQAFPGGFYFSKIDKRELRFTGRSALQTFLTCLSGGLL